MILGIIFLTKLSERSYFTNKAAKEKNRRDLPKKKEKVSFNLLEIVRVYSGSNHRGQSAVIREIIAQVQCKDN